MHLLGSILIAVTVVGSISCHKISARSYASPNSISYNVGNPYRRHGNVLTKTYYRYPTMQYLPNHVSYVTHPMSHLVYYSNYNNGHYRNGGYNNGHYRNGGYNNGHYRNGGYNYGGYNRGYKGGYSGQNVIPGYSSVANGQYRGFSRY